MNRRILIVFGTRPEAIKMAPVVKALQNLGTFDTRVCTTGQHKSILSQMLKSFEIHQDYDLDIMKARQTLADVTSGVIQGLSPIINDFQPDLTLVHGDTSTSFAAALACFYQQRPVGHVEAGLRTGQKFSPFPEEMNRKLTGSLADLHFAPTEQARLNLLAEQIENSAIFVTGNTVIDALKYAVAQIETHPELVANLRQEHNFLNSHRRIVLVTGHRRENFGEQIKSICYALLSLAERSDIEIVYPVHPNPNITEPVSEIIGKHPRIHLIPPQDYFQFVELMRVSSVILTDSGGIQEEAPFLGKPVLVMRDTTERPEAIVAGTVALVGTASANIVSAVSRLLDDDQHYAQFSRASNPYGDGFAALRIADAIASHLK